MPFSSLHAIELQLVMHCCSLPALLQLARCNRATLAAASTPFAWSALSRSAPPLPLSPTLAKQLPSSLLRFTRLTLLWRLPIPFRALRSISSTIDPQSFKAAHIWAQPVVSDYELESIQSALAVSTPAGGIVGLDATLRKNITPALWVSLFGSEAACRRLQTLRVYLSDGGPTSSAYARFLSLFSKLTSARVLEIDCAGSKLLLCRDSACDAAPAWSLRLSGMSGSAIAGLVSHHDLPALTALTLHHCARDFILRPPSNVDHWAARAFRAQPQLRTLTLDSTWAADAITAAATASCAQLETVVVSASALVFYPKSIYDPPLPRALTVEAALLASPSLLMRVSIPTESESRDYSPQCRQIYSDLCEVQKQFPTRFHIVHDS